MNQFRIVPRGPYSLRASADFLCGFTPATGSSCTSGDGQLVLGLLEETRHVPVTIALEQTARGEIHGAVAGGPLAPEMLVTIQRQVMRLLSLDHDARGLADVARRDPAIRPLLDAAPGFRPVCFPSPYEAAIWGVLAQRITMTVAAKIKQRLATETGTIAEGFGRTFHPSPAPERLLALRDFAGLPAEKLARLHAVATAALEGKLDATRLAAMTRADAVRELQQIRGVGPWTAEHILLRGCGIIDELPSAEPRVVQAIATTYGLSVAASAADAERIAEGWRPYRMWIAVLLVMNLRRSTSAWARSPRRGAMRAAASSEIDTAS